MFAFWGFFLSWYSQKHKEGVWANRATKYKKYVAGKCTRARAPLARKYTIRILESHWLDNKYKILNCIERHNFCLSELLTNSNRTTLQSHKVEERTFGTPCTFADKHSGCYGNGLIDVAEYEFGACSLWIVEDVGRGSFLFPIYLGRSKETLFAGYWITEMLHDNLLLKL